VTARGAEAVARRHHARPDDLAFLHRLSVADVVPGVGADVAHRREARLQRPLRVRNCQHRGEPVAELQIRVAAVRRVAVQMHMHVDQPGQDRLAGQIDPPRSGRNRERPLRPDRLHLVVHDHDRRRLHRAARDRVHHARGGQVDRLRLRRGGGERQGGHGRGGFRIVVSWMARSRSPKALHARHIEELLVRH
jgi:hypothetical protein